MTTDCITSSACAAALYSQKFGQNHPIPQIGPISSPLCLTHIYIGGSSYHQRRAEDTGGTVHTFRQFYRTLGSKAGKCSVNYETSSDNRCVHRAVQNSHLLRNERKSSVNVHFERAKLQTHFRLLPIVLLAAFPHSCFKMEFLPFLCFTNNRVFSPAFSWS